MEKSERYQEQEIDLVYELRREDFKLFFGAVDYTIRVAQYHQREETKLNYPKVAVPALVLATYNGVISLGAIFACNLISSNLVKLLR